jgi:hypothetical protein
VDTHHIAHRADAVDGRHGTLRGHAVQPHAALQGLCDEERPRSACPGACTPDRTHSHSDLTEGEAQAEGGRALSR